MVAHIDDESDIVGVKFLSHPRMIKHRLKSAEIEINRQIDKLRRVNIITKLNISHKIIITVVYNFKTGVNEGILLIKRNKI